MLKEEAQRHSWRSLTEEPVSPHATPAPQELVRARQVLAQGVRLAHPFSWKMGASFALISFVLTFAGLMAAAWQGWMTLAPWTLLAWSVLLTPFLFLPLFYLVPTLRQGPVLKANEHHLALRRGRRTLQELLLQPSFFASFLCDREGEEGLLVIQTRERQSFLFSGEFPRSIKTPPGVLPLGALHLSLEELSGEGLGAWMVPEEETDVFAELVALIWSSQGVRPYPRLPLERSVHTLRFDPNHLTWLYKEEFARRFPYDSLLLQPLTYFSKSRQSYFLLYQVDAFETTIGYDAYTPSSLLLAVDWPVSLDLHPLPRASRDLVEKAVMLTPVEFLIFAQALYQQGAISSPFSILERIEEESESLDELQLELDDDAFV